MGGKRIFLSDIHMGINAPWTWLSAAESKECAHFLTVINGMPDVSDVVLVGDIADDNVCPIDKNPANFQNILEDNINRDLVNALKTIDQKSSMKLHLIKGNHDVALDEATAKNVFPNLMFHENKFEVGNLIAIHGNAYQMWCAPDDRAENKFNPLPLGYFISRMWATMETKKNIKMKMPIAKLVSQAVKQNNIDPTRKSLLGINVPEVVIKYIVKKAELSLENNILMNAPYQNVKIKDLIANYQNLEKIWKKKFGMARFLDYAIKYDHFVGDMCLEKDKRVVIWGHTHDKILREPFPARKSAYVYANCGNWCDQEKRAPTFVETEADSQNRILYVRLQKWNIKKKKIEKINEMYIKE